MTDFATQRKAMVDSQIRPSDVTDRRIIRAMQEVPREVFVPGALRAIAHMDEHLQLGAGRAILAPRLFAKLVQSLDLEANAAVLDLGCASGYSTAVLAKLVGRVVALEPDAVLAERAQVLLGRNENVKVRAAGLAAGAADEAPFDAVLLNGAIPDVPRGLLDQLKDGGRLVAILVATGVGKATLWRRYGTQFDQRTLFDAGAPLLPGFERKAEFAF